MHGRDHLPLRFHRPTVFELGPEERVFFRSESGPSACVREVDVPKDKMLAEHLKAHLRETALERGGEWQAISECGEMLASYSTHNLFEELSGKKVITLQPIDQAYRVLACILLRVSPRH